MQIDFNYHGENTMQVKNNSVRAYHVGATLIAPGGTMTVADSFEKALDGNPDLEIVGGPAIEEKTMTKAELQNALLEKGVDYSPTANKSELQALHDAA
jgi:hypothetical protein